MTFIILWKMNMKKISICYQYTDIYIVISEQMIFIKILKIWLINSLQWLSKKTICNIPHADNKIMGKFKYENNRSIWCIKIQICIINVGGQETEKSKGVKKNVVENEITFEKYKIFK